MKALNFGQRKFKSLWIASTLEMTVGSFLPLTDSAIIGHIVGKDGLSAMNGIMPLITVSIFVGSVIASGSALAYSKASGAFGLSVLLAALTGLLIMLGGFLVIPRYLLKIGVSEDVRTLAGQYMTCFSVCLLPLVERGLGALLAISAGASLAMDFSLFRQARRRNRLAGFLRPKGADSTV